MGYVLDFQEIDHTQVAVVGGKGALLGELSRIEGGIPVPPGLCVTTDAFQRGSAVDRRSARSALALGAGGWGGDPRAECGDPSGR